MNGVRNEHGTPAYQSKPRSRAASTNWAASITRALRECRAARSIRRLRVREVAGAAEVVEIVDAAPVSVHVLHFDFFARFNQRVKQRGHVELVEIVALLEPGERCEQALACIAAHVEQAHP